MPAGRMKPGAHASRLIRLGFRIVCGFLLLAALGVALVYWVERTTLRSWSRKTERFVPKTPMRMQFFSAGLETPTTLPVKYVKLADDEAVIGLEAGGKARAYHVPTMCATSRHIVNDVLGGLSVSVTYCDLNDCARAFGGGAHTSPLVIAQAGLLDGRMLIKIDGVSYIQETGEIAETDPGKAAVPLPYARFPLTRTTWGEWKLRHPDSDVYVSAAALGDRASENRP